MVEDWKLDGNWLRKKYLVIKNLKKKKCFIEIFKKFLNG